MIRKLAFAAFLLLLTPFAAHAQSQCLAPNPPAGDNSNRCATTSWVQANGGVAVPVTVPNGGTGLTTLPSGKALIGNGTSNPTFAFVPTLLGPCDGSTDLTSTLNAAFAALPTNGGEIDLQAGNCHFASSVALTWPASTNFVLKLRGQGQGATSLSFGGGASGNGLIFNLSYPGHAYDVQGMSFLSSVANAGTGFFVHQTFQEGDYVNSVIRDVTFVGADGGGATDYWTQALLIEGESAVTIDNVTAYGANTGGGGGSYFGNGIQVEGDASGTNKYAVQINLISPYCYDTATCFSVGSYTQGVTITNLNATNGTTAIAVPSSLTGTLSQLTIIGGQIATYGNGIVFNTCYNQVSIQGMLIYVANSTGGIVGAPWCGGQIIGNNFYVAGTGSPKTGQVGINLTSYTAPVPTTVEGNTIWGMATGINYSSGVVNITQLGNSFNNNTTNSVNSGGTACPASQSGNCVGTATP